MTDAPTISAGRSATVTKHRVAEAGSLGAHAVAMAGQLAAGVGNFGFALIAGRLLEPGAFAALAAFLAVYLLVHVPSASLGAGAALHPDRLARATNALVAAGTLAALATAAAASPLSSAFNLPVAMVVALAGAMPAAGVLGVRRGVLYGTGRTTQVAASLAGEPAVRLVLGLPLIMAFGAPGGAFAVVAGGWIGLAIAGREAPLGPVASTSAPPAEHGTMATSAFTALTFLAFALIANQDLLVANAILSPGDAGGFAVLSVLGSAVAFATATIPMVLLPAATPGRSDDAGRLALVVTGAIGAAAVVVGVVGGRFLISLMFGGDHLHAAPLLGPYLVAMAALALGRVLAAQQCAEGRSRIVAVVVGTGVVAHLAILIAVTTTPGQIVAATAAATAATCLALVAVPSIDRRLASVDRIDDRSVAEMARNWLRRPDVAWVGAAMAVAVVIRVVMTRGLWVDEAISVAQAQLPFSDMLQELRWSDVHPPLHHVLLWFTVRIAGTGELAVRMPSILAGAAMVPVLYLLGRDLFDRPTARVAAAGAAVAPFLVWYSQEARMYAVFMLAATLAVLGQVRALRSNSVADWTLYTVATAAMAWSQYFAVLPIAVQQIAFLVILWQRRGTADLRQTALRWVASLAALAVLLAPITPIALDQMSNYLDRSGADETLAGAPAGHGPVDTSAASQGELSVYAAVANGLWGVWGYHSDRTMAQVAALWPLGMLAALLLLGRGRTPDTTLLLALIAVPAITLFGVGVFKRDLFELRYFCGAVPLAILFASRAATRFGTTPRTRMAFGALLVATLTIGLVDQQLNGTNPRRYDFDGAIGAVQETWEEGAILLYEPTYLSEVVDYYGPDLVSRPIGALTSPTVDDAPVVYVLATERVINERETAARVGDVLARLENDGRQMVARTERPNVTVWELR